MALGRAHYGAWLTRPLSWFLRLGDGGSYQVADTGNIQIRDLSDPDMPNQFSRALQQATRILQQRAEIEPQIDPIRMRGDENKCITRPIREREVVGDCIHLVHELVGFGSLDEDESARGQSEALNGLAIALEKLEVPWVR